MTTDVYLNSATATAGRICFYAGYGTGVILTVKNVQIEKKDHATPFVVGYRSAVWYDLSGNNNNGTLINGVDYSSNNNGYLTFDGTDDYIDLGSFFTYQTFTIDIWVNTGSTQNTYADIFDNNHTGSRNFVCQQIDVNTNLYNFGVMDAAGTISHTGNFTLSPNVWTNLTFTFTPSDRVKLYVNGYLSASGALANNRNILYESQTLSIGRWGAGGRNWNGNMSNFKVYNKVLSSTEVLQNYKALRRRYI